MIKKAVIPAAGFGTRLLPATKSQPKEMLPIVDMPTIQYVVEEAVESGITDILMVIGKGKRAIEEHFDRSFELEYALEQKEKVKELEAIREISRLADIHFVWQKELNGLGDAIRYARHHIGREPFAVLLGDTIMESDGQPITRQLMEVFNHYHASVVALEEVDPSLVYRYGVMGGVEVEKHIYKVEEFVEKPTPEEAPSRLVIAGRYVFTPEIFDYLKIVPRGKNNEIQLTDAMALMLQDQAMYALHFDGKRHDIGNKLDFIRTNLLFGLKRPDMGEELRSWILELAESLKREQVRG
ncbi:MAG: UTP--glucose-1-phosphate uridylyltransferase [Bacteroidetes bacterium]|nr:MAG: UTP--glucose-1-phosphate uridylyltransferase [Bacteroidota bacterium]